MNSNEGLRFLKQDATKGARILPENIRDAGLAGREAATCCLSTELPDSARPSSADEFQLEDRWVIDANLLFVGPKIGEGSHSKVYEGKYHDEDVAVKIIQPGETPKEIAKRQSRFGREISLLQRVQHKNLVKVIFLAHGISNWQQ